MARRVIMSAVTLGIFGYFFRSEKSVDTVQELIEVTYHELPRALALQLQTLDIYKKLFQKHAVFLKKSVFLYFNYG